MFHDHESGAPNDACIKKMDVISRNLSDLDVWRSNINRDMTALEERISILELENVGSTKPGSHEKSGLAIDDPEYKNRCPDGFGIDKLGSQESWIPTAELSCKQRWIYYLKTQRSSRGQLFLLLVFLAIFLIVGFNEFERAKLNEEAEFKPEKKEYIRDYQARILSEHYEMPYFYFHVLVNLGNVSTENIDIDEYLTWFMESQNYFNGSGTIVYYSEGVNGVVESNEELPVEEVDITAPKEFAFKNSFWFWYRVKYAPPDPSKGNWHLLIRLRTDLITLDGLVSIDLCLLAIKREILIFKAFDGIRITHVEDKVTAYSISYEERVTSRLDNKADAQELTVFSRPPGLMESSEVDTILNISAENGDTVMLVLPDLLVEYWEEYVDYGYWDCFTAMGGMFSIASAMFFWLAYYFGKILGDDVSRVGILGELSFLYANFENIRWIKQVLGRNMIMPQEKEITIEFTHSRESYQ